MPPNHTTGTNARTTDTNSSHALVGRRASAQEAVLVAPLHVFVQLVAVIKALAAEFAQRVAREAALRQRACGSQSTWLLFRSNDRRPNRVQANGAWRPLKPLSVAGLRKQRYSRVHGYLFHHFNDARCKMQNSRTVFLQARCAPMAAGGRSSRDRPEGLKIKQQTFDFKIVLHVRRTP